MSETAKNLEYYLSRPYTIELTPDEDGWKVASPTAQAAKMHWQ